MPPAELWLLDDGRVLGGGQLFALRLARHVGQARGRDAIRIVCPPGSEVARQAERDNIRTTPLDIPTPVNLPGVALAGQRLRRLLRSSPGALVVAGSARCQAVAVAAGLDDRLVHLMVERDSADRRSVRLVHARRGRVVAVGESAARAYGSPSVRNFLLPEDFDRLAGAQPPPERGVLGVLGRLIPEKGVLELIGELEQAKGWTRLVVGGDQQDAAYAARVRDAATERVELAGRVDDIVGFLSSIDVLVVPSVGHEGQPTVILEGLAAGRPVVVRDALTSADYEGLPVFGYGDLGAALQHARSAPAPDAALLRERFGPGQVLAALEGPA